MIRAEALRGRLLPDASSEALALAATGGDDEAFTALIRRFQRRLLGFAYQHLRDPDEAQDLAQEVFVRLHAGLRRYDAARPFEPWFWKLAGNVALNYARRHRRDRGLPEPPADLAAAPAAESTLAEALGTLDASARLPLLLHYYSGLSIEEVAGVLDLSVPALKSRMHRARAVLRRALAESE